MGSFILANHRLFLIVINCGGIVRFFLQGKDTTKALVFASGLHVWENDWGLKDNGTDIIRENAAPSPWTDHGQHPQIPTQSGGI